MPGLIEVRFMVKKQSQPDAEEKKQNELIQELNQKIAISQWIQFIGQLANAIYASQLSAIQPESSGELTNVVGNWIMTVGQGLSAIGQTTQTLTDEQRLLIEGQIQGIQGDALQALGAAIQVIGDKEVLIDSLLADIEEYIQ